MALLADDLFFIVHDEHNARLRVHRRVAGIGLAGALLGELSLTGNIHAAAGSLAILDQVPPEDDLAYRVLYQLAAEPQHQSVRTWLTFLAQGAIDRVGMRLAHARRVSAAKSRRPWGTSVRYQAIDLRTAAWPAARLNLRVNRGDPLTVADAMLAGLVAATGLTKKVWWDGNALTTHHLTAAVASLPMSLREVLSHTEAAVGDAVLGPNM